jgi:hypothetical protein
LNRILKQDLELNSDARPVPSRQLTELLSKALLDKELRERILVNPEAMAREFDLPPAEADAIKRLDRRTFEQAVTRLRWG